MDSGQHADVYSKPAPVCTAWHEPASQAHRCQCLQNTESNRNICSTTHSQRHKATSEMDNTGVNQHCVKRVYLQTNQAAWLQREQWAYSTGQVPSHTFLLIGRFLQFCIRLVPEMKPCEILENGRWTQRYCVSNVSTTIIT